MKIGYKVKVTKPCKTSRNEKGLVGFITDKFIGKLEGFSASHIYRVCKKKKCEHHKEHLYGSSEYKKQGWFEHETGIELFDKTNK